MRRKAKLPVYRFVGDNSNKGRITHQDILTTQAIFNIYNNYNFYNVSKTMLLARYQFDLLEAGCDEAGRGCLAGPVFAAAVILPDDFNHDLLNDSKQLSEEIRYELRIEIEQKAIAYAVATVDNEEIDKINILNASFLAMHRAIEKLALVPEFLIIDGNRFNKYGNTPHKCIVEGDAKYFSIAAASILAKTYRDDYMKQIAVEHPEYDWHKNKGYPTTKHRETILKIGFTPYHRLTFRVTDPQLDLFNDLEPVA